MFAILFYTHAAFMKSAAHSSASFEDIYARDAMDGTGNRATFVKPPGYRAHEVMHLSAKTRIIRIESHILLFDPSTRSILQL